MSEKPENVVQWVYSSKNNTELAERYDEWDGSYDKDLHTDFGWLSPRKAVDAFAKRVPRHARVLDAGAGTGLWGSYIYEQDGFREKQSSLEAEGQWRLVEEGEKYQPMPKGEPEVYHQVWTYEIL